MFDVFNLQCEKHWQNIMHHKYCPWIGIVFKFHDFQFISYVKIPANCENTVILCINKAALTVRVSFPMTTSESRSDKQAQSFNCRRSSSFTEGT